MKRIFVADADTIRDVVVNAILKLKAKFVHAKKKHGYHILRASFYDPDNHNIIPITMI